MESLSTGYALDAVRTTGTFMVKDPDDAPATGDFLLEVTKGVISARVTFRQILTELNSGTVYIRVYVPYTGWSEWTEVGSQGGKLLPPASGALDLYVATTGSDTTGDGSAENPWATPTGAWKKLSTEYDLNNALVRVNFAAGTYPPLYAFGDILNDADDANELRAYRPTAGAIIEFLGVASDRNAVKFQAGPGAWGSAIYLDVTGIQMSFRALTIDCNETGGSYCVVYGNGKVEIYDTPLINVDYGTAFSVSEKCLSYINPVWVSSAKVFDTLYEVYDGSTCISSTDLSPITAVDIECFNIYGNSFMTFSSLFAATISGRQYTVAEASVLAAGSFPGDIPGREQTGGQAITY